jgi:hypothetical protein
MGAVCSMLARYWAVGHPSMGCSTSEETGTADPLYDQRRTSRVDPFISDQGRQVQLTPCIGPEETGTVDPLCMTREDRYS